MVVDVILLAGGYGKRLKPITDFVPKCLAPISGRPLLDIWLETLKHPKVSQVLINTHFFSAKVGEFVKTKKMNNVTLFYEKDLLGTAGTIRKLIKFIDADFVFVAHADNLSIFDLNQFFIKFYERPKNIIGTMMLFKTKNPENCGIVKTDKEGIITEYYEKNSARKGNLANGAVYIFDKIALKHHLREDDYDFSADTINRIFPFMNTFENKNLHIDIGTVPDFLAAQYMIKT